MSAIRVIDVYPEDVRIKMEIHKSALEKLVLSLSNAQLGHATSEEKEAADYTRGFIYPFLSQVLSDIRERGL